MRIIEDDPNLGQADDYEGPGIFVALALITISLFFIGYLITYFLIT